MKISLININSPSLKFQKLGNLLFYGRISKYANRN